MKYNWCDVKFGQIKSGILVKQRLFDFSSSNSTICSKEKENGSLFIHKSSIHIELTVAMEHRLTS